ncbi:MAG: hypothetical protein RIQ44_666, partial [Actinomycetota bacterium]
VSVVSAALTLQVSHADSHRFADNLPTWWHTGNSGGYHTPAAKVSQASCEIDRVRPKGQHRPQNKEMA